jgi:hypothetical protein
MRRWIITTLLAGALALGACNGDDAPTPDAGAPDGSYCRSQTGCTCLPAFGTPCACEGECVTSCDPLPKCAW